MIIPTTDLNGKPRKKTGFENCTETPSWITLDTSNKIPSWISGSLYRIGYEIAFVLM
jgi:hypothetical protein